MPEIAKFDCISMKRVLLFAVLFGLHCFLKSQEREGMSLSNYQLTINHGLNPAFTNDSRTYLQLNLIGLNVGMYNNLLQLTNFKATNLVQSPGQLPAYTPVAGNAKKFLYLAALVDAPSFFISKGKIGAGIFFKARSVADIRRMPYQITDFLLSDNSPDESQSVDISARNAKIANMSWVEYGGNFSYMYKHRAYDIISIGANLKYLTGLNLQYAKLKNLEAAYVPSVSIIANIDGVYRSSAFAWKAGSGFGTDLGITFKRTLKQADSYNAHMMRSVTKCKPMDYEFKLGLSVRDLGFIKFKKETAVMTIAGSGTINNNSTPRDELEKNFSQETTNGTAITAFLPLALNLHGDYNFGHHVYVGGIIQKALTPNSLTGVMASDYAAIIPRYETKNLELALPVSLNNFRQPELGFAFRFRTFVLGADNLLPFIKTANVKTMGIYLNFGWSLFRNQKCKTVVRKIDDCSRFKSGQAKIKFKSSLINASPLKEKTSKQKHKTKRAKLHPRLLKRR